MFILPSSCIPYIWLQHADLGGLPASALGFLPGHLATEQRPSSSACPGPSVPLPTPVLFTPASFVVASLKGPRTLLSGFRTLCPRREP